jgi:hypothetical protein
VAARPGAVRRRRSLDSLPHGGNTLLSRKFQSGRDLSGGQWQRLGIARRLYHEMCETQASAYRAPSDVDVSGASARCADADGVEVGLHDP